MQSQMDRTYIGGGSQNRASVCSVNLRFRVCSPDSSWVVSFNLGALWACIHMSMDNGLWRHARCMVVVLHR